MKISFNENDTNMKIECFRDEFARISVLLKSQQTQNKSIEIWTGQRLYYLINTVDSCPYTVLN